MKCNKKRRENIDIEPFLKDNDWKYVYTLKFKLMFICIRGLYAKQHCIFPVRDVSIIIPEL